MHTVDDQNNSSSGPAPQVRKSWTGKIGWLICLLLLLALLVLLWFFWKQPEVASPAVPQKDSSEDQLALMQKETHELEALIVELQKILAADPCAIPQEFRGLLLAPASGIEGGPRPERSTEPKGSDLEKAPSQPETEAKTSEAAKTGTAAQGATTLKREPDSQASTPDPASPPAAESPETDFEASNDAIEAATALVLTKEGLGTGFFVAPGLLVTNRHVVEEAPDSVVLVNSSLGGVVDGSVVAISNDKRRDYAIIRVASTNSPIKKLPDPLPICGVIKKTEKVATWGYPGVLSVGDPKFKALLQGDFSAAPEKIYTEGVVSVVYETEPPRILHTATTSKGNSGGPLVNEQGCVVGITTMIHMDKETYRQTSVALSSKDLVKFLQEHGINPKYTNKHSKDR